MGKVTRGRKKYHASKMKQSGPSSGNDEAPAFQAQQTTPFSITTLPTFEPRENIFAGLNISADLLQQELDIRSIADDTRSVISKKSFKSERPYKKKDKRLIRRELFLAKLNIAKQVDKEAKERKRRQKTVITGDMQPLADALPDLTEIPTKISGPQPKARSIPKLRKRQQDMLSDIAWMRQALAKNKS